jgi:uncharacterized protein (TIGR03382 family)
VIDAACANSSDDNYNGLVDCADALCADQAHCAVKAVAGSDTSCQGTPKAPAGHGPLAAMILGMLGLGALWRRRKVSE